jgi:glycosyltransferase involved in cell wall biosynthesis
LIVDDGSTDSTRDLIQKWQGQIGHRIPIRCVGHDRNRGALAAYNTAVHRANGRFLYGVDLDDELLPTALERLAFHWDAIPDDVKPSFAAVTGLCVDQFGAVVGSRYPTSPLDSNSLETSFRYGIVGEKSGFTLRDVMLQFPSPEERGFSEGEVWFQIARTYKTRYINEPFRVYWCDEPGRQDQLSSHSSIVGVARGSAHGNLVALNEAAQYLRYAPIQLLRVAAHYVRFSLHAGDGPLTQLQCLHTARARALWAIALPIGFAAFAADRGFLPGSIISGLRRITHG